MEMCFILFILFTAISVRGDEEKYTSKYDNIDYRSILASERLLNNYFRCMMDEGPCTPDAQDLKKVIPDILQTECSKCTDKQKAAGREIMKYLVDKKLDMWKKIVEKYDPQGIYKEKYRDEWIKEGFPEL
nr:chemosensory protein 6 [Ophraella communa]